MTITRDSINEAFDLTERIKSLSEERDRYREERDELVEYIQSFIPGEDVCVSSITINRKQMDKIRMIIKDMGE